MQWYEILKAVREDSGESMSKAAEAIGIPKGTYASYEYGKREPNIEMISKIAEHFGITTDYLLGRPDAKPPEDPIKLAAQEFRLDSTQRGILAAYLYMDPDDRKQFISYIKQIVEGVGKEDSSIKSRIQKKGMSSIAHAVRAAARSNGIKAVVVDDDGHIMTEEQIDAIRKALEMNTNL